MPRKVALDQAYDPVEVSLLGESFLTVDITRSGSKKAGELLAAADKTDDDDEAVKMLAQLLDLKLKSANGKQTKPSTVIIKKWNADQLSARSLLGFVEKLAEADRPT